MPDRLQVTLELTFRVGNTCTYGPQEFTRSPGTSPGFVPFPSGILCQNISCFWIGQYPDHSDWNHCGHQFLGQHYGWVLVDEGARAISYAEQFLMPGLGLGIGGCIEWNGIFPITVPMQYGRFIDGLPPDPPAIASGQALIEQAP